MVSWPLIGIVAIFIAFRYSKSENRHVVRFLGALFLLGLDFMTSSLYSGDAVLRGGAPGGWIAIPLGVLSLCLITWHLLYGISHGYLLGGGGATAAALTTGNVGLALISSAGLLIDYPLTINVSTSSGWDQILSIFGQLKASPVTHIAGIWMFIFLTRWITLRGRGESSFIATLFGVGLVISLAIAVIAATIHPAHAVQAHAATEVVTTHPEQGGIWYLIFHSIANGVLSVTGVEALSNGLNIIPHMNSRVTWLNGRVGSARIMHAILAVFGVALLVATVMQGMRHGITDQTGDTTMIVAFAKMADNGLGLVGFSYGAALVWAIVLGNASLTAFQDIQNVCARLALFGALPAWFAKFDQKGVYRNTVNATTLITLATAILAGGSTHHLEALYALGVVTTITVMSHSMAEIAHTRNLRGLQIFCHYSTALSASIFVLLSWMKWDEGAWAVLVIMTGAIVSMVLYLLSHQGSMTTEKAQMILAGPSFPKDMRWENTHNAVVVQKWRHSLLCRFNAESVYLAFEHALSIDDIPDHQETEIPVRAGTKGMFSHWGSALPLFVRDFWTQSMPTDQQIAEALPDPENRDITQQ